MVLNFRWSYFFCLICFKTAIVNFSKIVFQNISFFAGKLKLKGEVSWGF